MIIYFIVMRPVILFETPMMEADFDHKDSLESMVEPGQADAKI